MTTYSFKANHAENKGCVKFQLNLTLKEEKADLGTYVLNGEWHLLGKPGGGHTVVWFGQVT